MIDPRADAAVDRHFSREAGVERLRNLDGLRTFELRLLIRQLESLR